MSQTVIRTGVDQLVDLTGKEKKISIGDAAKTLGISKDAIEEWASFLEEEGLISVEHTFANTFLVRRKFSKVELANKIKDYEGEQEAFLRHIEGTRTTVLRAAEDIRSLRAEFRDVQKDLGEDLEKVHEQIGDITKFQEYEEKIRAKKIKFEKDYRAKIDSVSKRLGFLQSRLDALANKKTSCMPKKTTLSSLLQKEEALLSSLKSFDAALLSINPKWDCKDINAEELGRLQGMRKDLQAEIDHAKKDLNRLVKELQSHESKTRQMEQRFLSMLAGSKMLKKKSMDTKEMSAAFEKFFRKYDQIKNTLELLDGRYAALEELLERLTHKTLAFNLVSRKGEGSVYIENLEKQLALLDNERSSLLNETKTLRSVLKKRVSSNVRAKRGEACQRRKKAKK
ncbi:MAG: hypothetical protein ACE5DM_01830 [Candidatus Nanoarchaeia archaeon]